MQIKTIDIHAKEWFDQVNGNSYCAVQTTLNYAMPDEVVLYSPFQYGYGSFYEQAAFAAIREAGFGLESDTSIRQYCRDSDLILRSHIDTRCRKREVKDWGQES